MLCVLAVPGKGDGMKKILTIVLVLLMVLVLLSWVLLAGSVSRCSNCNPWGTPYPTLEWELVEG